jgi:hypothetical protein
MLLIFDYAYHASSLLVLALSRADLHHPFRTCIPNSELREPVADTILLDITGGQELTKRTVRVNNASGKGDGESLLGLTLLSSV